MGVVVAITVHTHAHINVYGRGCEINVHVRTWERELRHSAG